MLRSSSIYLVIFFWTLVFIVNAVLKNYRKYSRRYKEFLEDHGITMSLCQIRWYTTQLNRWFIWFGRLHPYLLHLWFSLGVFVGVGLMALSVMVLSLTLYQAFTKEAPEQVLTPVMPGVNLPWSQLMYYLITLAVSGVFHEMGHAVAAVREQVRVNGFGMFFMAIYPGAYVDLYTDHLTMISPIRQLRIYCAGVWHNVILVLLGLLLLWSLPYLLVPLYMADQGAVVTKVSRNSPVFGSINRGDTIYSVYGCPVNNKNDWIQCVSRTLNSPQHGYCSNMFTVTRQNSSQGSFTDGVYECCGNLTTSSRLCFRYESIKSEKGYACLAARSIMQASQFCSLPEHCHGPGNKACVHPSLDNSSRLIRVRRLGGPDVLYVGDPILLQYTVAVVNYSPRSPILPMELPTIIETFLIYLISLSGALALLNIVPCYSLDGQWALFALVDHTLGNIIPNEDQRSTLCTVILTMGTLLLAANITLALWTLGSV
ncbi:predicted protein [Nematostella vectensis]|uniref:Membrane-bound transcription factor site-2 protease n=1 Tax=Nematostella vectensis TaxID=45351 RepID=A7S5C2_NEMVE|nr:predicted protein [Nematostella vectensis]|eukprot:XP_001633156.1 predicted protein [Nematostella vectensis]